MENFYIASFAGSLVGYPEKRQVIQLITSGILFIFIFLINKSRIYNDL